MNNDLISREALKNELRGEVRGNRVGVFFAKRVFDIINNAPTVEPTFKPIAEVKFDKEQMQELVDKAKAEVLASIERPQGEREFIEILARYEPDDICTYPEYRGKPYYSIHYRENGEEFVGYGTYNIEVLSRYLKDYFF